MAGLNDPTSARTPPSLARVRELAPAVVLYHYGATLDVASLAPTRAPMVRVEPEALARAVRAEFRDLYEHGAESYADHRPHAGPADQRRLEALRPRIVRQSTLLAERETPLGPTELLLRFDGGERGALHVDERPREIAPAALVLHPVEANVPVLAGGAIP